MTWWLDVGAFLLFLAMELADGPRPLTWRFVIESVAFACACVAACNLIVWELSC